MGFSAACRVLAWASWGLTLKQSVHQMTPAAVGGRVFITFAFSWGSCTMRCSMSQARGCRVRLHPTADAAQRWSGRAPRHAADTPPVPYSLSRLKRMCEITDSIAASAVPSKAKSRCRMANFQTLFKVTE